MGLVNDLSEKAWAGEFSGTMVRPDATPVLFEEYAPGLAFVNAFSNVLAVETGAGLTLIDTSSLFHAPLVFRAVRAWSTQPLHSAVYTHGHVDHVFGLQPFEQEAEALGHPKAQVVAHEAVAQRFERYVLTNGYNALINQRQFGFPVPFFPKESWPDKFSTSRLFRLHASWTRGPCTLSPVV